MSVHFFKQFVTREALETSIRIIGQLLMVRNTVRSN